MRRPTRKPGPVVWSATLATGHVAAVTRAGLFLGVLQLSSAPHPTRQVRRLLTLKVGLPTSAPAPQDVDLWVQHLATWLGVEPDKLLTPESAE